MSENNILQLCDICKGYYPYKEFDNHVKSCLEYYQKLKSQFTRFTHISTPSPVSSSSSNGSISTYKKCPYCDLLFPRKVYLDHFIDCRIFRGDEAPSDDP
ncbi:hypothetical protein CJU89_4091 [Yarrowia sp. B02]|nr:hypothetical protein CJU89_4091 [Yarrowia sp. B02]